MSKTRRKDAIDVEVPPPDMIMFGKASSFKPTPKEIERAHRDKKKAWKPTKTFKKGQRKKDSVKSKNVLRRALAQGKDLDNLILPDAKKHDMWDWS